ncbi:MAG TPA: hypothetical protein PK903_00585 [Paludibacteraceae bacterium]|jgi:TM2 domain-containing membrane protein YozV|nr:hypothetical protein [Paludibacteraceae bacterium]MDS1031092.1 hypothetical protein [Porphyromonadaceae sp. NP-X]NLJ19885.1 hypothetical protein [Bacteroidales bacterium]MBP9016266.1 hypothetical protein [Paludibacteraceae bacterium]HNZ61957.1 hypothetical protein [Paludibacteraceae bacterium]
MKKQILILLFCWAGVFSLLTAQDTIVFKNGETKACKITQIKTGELTCKDFSYLDGPDYVYELKKIQEIHFSNGVVQTYNIPDVSEINEEEESITVSRGKISNFTQDSWPPPIKFKTYKEKENYYKDELYFPKFGDPYHPWVAGLASYFIPGLGQMTSGEIGRGFAFMGGAAASLFVLMIGYIGVIEGIDSYYNDDYYTSENNQIFPVLTLGGFLSYFVINIWSAVDAFHVAKINNLYQRDLHSQEQVKLQLSPYIDTNKFDFSLNHQHTMGLSLQINF